MTKLTVPLQIPAFRRLFASRFVSSMGDWAARIALAVVVLERTGSPFLTGVVTAASFVAWLGPGQMAVAELRRYRHKTLMITADLWRASLFGVMLLPIPAWALIVAAMLAGFGGPVFDSSRSALTVEVVPTDIYPDALALLMATVEATTILGYLAGGVAVATLGSTATLAANAATFALSALLIVGIPEGERANVDEGARAHLIGGIRVIRDDPVIRRAIGLNAVCVLPYVAVEATAVVYARSAIHHAPALASLFLVTLSAVALVSMSVIPRGGAPGRVLNRSALVGAGAAALATVAFAAGGLGGGVIGYAALGLVGGSQILLQAVGAPRIPKQHRAPAFVFINGSMQAASAAGAALGGLMAGLVGVSTMAVAASAVIVAICLASIAVPAKLPDETPNEPASLTAELAS